MEDAIEDEEQKQLLIKRPFQTKFMGQLNYMQNEKNKKNKRKQREIKNIDPRKAQKFQKIGMAPGHKPSRRLPQTNRNGNRVFGYWKNNQIQGQAQIVYTNGVIFRGTYQNGIKIKGYFQFLHGYEYIGHCLGNKFNGEGSLIFPSGKIITGEWKDYTLVDKGKIQYPNGEVYYGQIKNLKKHGKGYLFFQDNSKFVGEFQNGQIMGYGTFYVNGQPVSSGNWVDGQLEQTIDLSKIESQGSIESIDPKQYNLYKTNKQIEGALQVPKPERKVKPQKKLRFADTTAHSFAQLNRSIPQF